jgi:3-deoxy-D-manno-octulosonate 8-phosphate phosphatase KdsC-like HAD superfamily phosphatase
MSPSLMTSSPTTAAKAWEAAQSQLHLGHERLGELIDGHSGQLAHQALLESERHCTELAHSWLASALELQRVSSPIQVLSLDVDGVLEDESAGYSSTGLTGVAALKLMQLGGIAVLLNTARNLGAVEDRVEQFKLLGGVASFGTATWDGVFGRRRNLMSELAAAELDRLRGDLKARDGFVVDSCNGQSLRVSQVVDGLLRPIVGTNARNLLDELSLTTISYWVGPRYTYFVDSSVDKAVGINSLCEDLGLTTLPVAAMGDSACDVPMLRLAKLAFVPAATLPSYVPYRNQRLFRSRHLGQQALWESACRLVPNSALQRQVLLMVSGLELPTWLPRVLVAPPTMGGRFGLRLATMFNQTRLTDRSATPRRA